MLMGVVFPGNHSAVWGSFFRGGKWGFACCRQFLKQSYCTGADGIAADEAAQRLARGELDWTDSPSVPVNKSDNSKAEVVTSAIKEHIAKRKRREESTASSSNKRSFMVTDGMTEEEYEEYRRNKVAHDDPLLTMQSLEGGA